MSFGSPFQPKAFCAIFQGFSLRRKLKSLVHFPHTLWVFNSVSCQNYLVSCCQPSAGGRSSSPLGGMLGVHWSLKKNPGKLVKIVLVFLGTFLLGRSITFPSLRYWHCVSSNVFFERQSAALLTCSLSHRLSFPSSSSRTVGSLLPAFQAGGEQTVKRKAEVQAFTDNFDGL